MLESIKKKLSSAIKEGIQITENLSTQLTGVGSSSLDSAVDTELGIPLEVNINAGSELLQRYEDDWRSTYEANKTNAEVAKEITDSIDRIRLRMRMRQVNMTDLVTCLSGLPTIEKNLKDCLDKFDEIEQLARDAEDKINELSNVCHMLDTHEHSIERNLEEKRRELEKLRAVQHKHAEERQKRLREEEEKFKQLQEERHAAFEEAFIDDMNEYKMTGSVSKIALTTARFLTLEEVELNMDSDGDLEEFLKE